MKKGVIFDMDGLLIDSEKIWQKNWRILAKEFGYEPVPEFSKKICGTSGQHMLDVITTYYPGVDPVEFRRIERERVKRDIYEGVDLKPGVCKLLSFLKEKGIPMAVASSSAMTLIEHNLTSCGIREYFDAVVSSEAVTNGKPAPDIFLLAAEKLGIPASDCYVFEDAFSGVRAGVASGAATIMIPDLLEPDDFAREHCAGIFKDLSEACDALAFGLV